MRKSTAIRIVTPCNASPIMRGLQQIGATVDYATERTIDFILEGARMQIGHNWDDERFVLVVSLKDKQIQESLIKRVKKAVEQQPTAIPVHDFEMSMY